MSVTVYGASDDLIEIEGDIREEFNWIPDGDETRLLAFSDGTLLRVAYDSDGIWRLNKVASGTAQFSKVECDVEKDTPDNVTLSGVEIKWVVLGEQSAIQKRAQQSVQADGDCTHPFVSYSDNIGTCIGCNAVVKPRR